MKLKYLFFLILLIFINTLLASYIFSDTKKVISESSLFPSPEKEDYNYVPYFITSEKLWDTVNNWRLSQNLPEYKQSEFLCNIAETRLKDIKTNYSHEGLHAIKWCQDCYLGENLASFYDWTENTLLNTWLRSPSHRENLIHNYTHSCITTDGNLAVQIFGYY